MHMGMQHITKYTHFKCFTLCPVSPVSHLASLYITRLPGTIYSIYYCQINNFRCLGPIKSFVFVLFKV